MSAHIKNELNTLWNQANTLETVHKDKRGAEALRALYWQKYRAAKQSEANRYINK